MSRSSPARTKDATTVRTVLFSLWLLRGTVLHAQAPSISCTCDDLMGQATAAEHEGRLADAGALLDSAVALGRRSGDEDLVARTLVQRSNVHRKQGLPDRSLTDLLAALDLRERLHDSKGLAEVTNNIGSIHQQLKNFTKAQAYYERSLALYTALGQRREVGKLLNNFGALYEDQGRPDSALGFHRRSLAVWEALNERAWMAVSYWHVGECHRLLAHHDSALHYLERSVHILRDAGDPFLLGMVYSTLGRVHLSDGRPGMAIARCREVLSLAHDLESMPLEQRACECLAEAYEDLGDPAQALGFHKRYIALRDSITGQEMVKELTRLELGHAFAQQQLADSLANAADQLRKDLVFQGRIAREREQRNIFLFSGIGVLMLAGGLWSRARNLRRSRTAIRRERDRSDALLLNILPGEVAAELKQKGTAEARYFEQATILFSDLKGFTSVSEQLSPQDLVEELNTCFKAFDAIMERHGVEKIKTIGDAYMAVGGLPDPRHGAPADVVRAALDMQAFMKARKTAQDAAGRPAFEMRVGIHTGPVVAGIVGTRKFQYDIWGDAVNTASRMESSGEAGRVNISAVTHALVKDLPGLRFTARGMVQAKGKGALGMWFVEGD